MKYIFLILAIALGACSMQSQLNKAFIGKDLSVIEQELKMKATRVIELENGHSKAIFVRDKTLKPTIINQGQGTLDPISSPSVDKTEYFTFILDQYGKVIESKYEKEYERR